MKATSTVLLVWAVVFSSLAILRGADSAADSSPFVVDAYDPKRIAKDDVETAVAKAKSSGKRILLQVGGDWCGWCHLMSKYFKENESVSKALAKNYLIVKVNYSEENQNAEFLSKYPKVMAYPHLFVLDSDGEFLHSQGTAELEEGKGYNESKILTFLSKWAPKR
jgi:thioredoxin-related protein